MGENYLLFLSNRIGDVIFCTPAIRILKENRPDSRIDAIVLSKDSAEVLFHNPCLDRIIISPTNQDLKKLTTNYDAVIDFHNNHLTRGYIDILGLADKVFKYKEDKGHSCEIEARLVKNAIKDESDSSILRYQLYPEVENFRKIDELINANETEDKILVGCHIGSSRLAKKSLRFWKNFEDGRAWPVEKFIELEKKFKESDSRIRFVITGHKNEAGLGTVFEKRSPDVINLIGQTSVLDLAALMKRLAVFICADTGPLHIACAMNVPIVTFFGPTDLELTGPYPARDATRVLFGNPVRTIEVDQVYSEVVNLLSKLGK